VAVVLIEGFDHTGTVALLGAKAWIQSFGSGGASANDTGRISGNSLKIVPNDNLGQVYKILPAAYSTLIAGFAFKHGTIPAAVTQQLFCRVQAGAAQVLTLSINRATLKLEVRNAAGTLIKTGDFQYLDDGWNYVEFKVVIAGASGTIQVRANGVDDIATFTGNFASANADTLLLSAQGAGGGATTGYYDDVYVLDTTGAAPRNTFLGDVRVETLAPSAAGNSTVWTPNTGANYAAVDEMTGTYPDGDTTYVSSATPGDIDTYTYADLAAPTDYAVFGVQTNLYARKDDAGARQIAPVRRQSGTDYVGSTVTLSTSYVYYSEIFNQDPVAADWTVTNVNAQEFGVKEIA
jgi:hypothetical protein